VAASSGVTSRARDDSRTRVVTIIRPLLRLFDDLRDTDSSLGETEFELLVSPWFFDGARAPIPRSKTSRWVVARTFSWLGRNRRLARFREVCRDAGHLRYPRLYPAGPQAARRGV